MLRMAVGTAKDAEGLEYEMTTAVAGGYPIIRSLKTGRWFTLSWIDILELAIERGIDEEAKEVATCA